MFPHLFAGWKLHVYLLVSNGNRIKQREKMCGRRETVHVAYPKGETANTKIFFPYTPRTTHRGSVYMGIKSTF